MGVNNGDYIYYRVGVSPSKPEGNRWIRAGGRLRQVDVFGMTISGVNSGRYTYKSPLYVAGIADGFNNKQDALSACADRSYCKGVIYRTAGHGKYYLCRGDKLVRTGGHEIAYTKTGESTDYGGVYWIGMEYIIGQRYEPTVYTSLNVARKKCLASKTVSFSLLNNHYFNSGFCRKNLSI